MTLIDLTDARESSTPVPAVMRAVRILDVMAQNKGPVTLSEIARATGMAKSSISNLMTTLQAAGMARQLSRGWVLGYKVLELGQSVLSSTDLVSEFRRLANMLPTLREETALIAVLDGLDVLYLSRHNGNQPVRLATDVGHRLPAVVTGLGKAMLASLPEDEMNARLETVTEMPRLTNHSFRTVDELRRDLAAIRVRGYSIDDQQNTTGVTCFGVAITGLRQPTAVSSTLLSYRATPELRDRLILDLRKLSRQLAGAAT
ncbi:IclR family transcriptional regulator [Agreia sp. PsM10]|uniref:IclR family transcriptional regulator n=1 Tax=Agreia sp. PsM10 TaxID=3030533 RepID=UPI00263A71E8|nr:IclR family transcriptional regulator [Agreia sp. PsM10]MDN4641491.1 IclR family transcriptional regulator [Agreia sp. PsM10]